MKAIFRTGILIAFASLFTVPEAFAATIYTADLLPSNEVPPHATSATGSATVTLNGDLLNVDITFADLTSPASAAHIHCCTAPGSNTGVALPFTGFPNAISGNYLQTFDLSSAGTYLSSFLANHGSTAAGAEAALVAGLNAGMAYVNIHNAEFPGGEIRGFLNAQTPEPASLELAGLALIGIALLGRRR